LAGQKYWINEIEMRKKRLATAPFEKDRNIQK